MQTKEIIKYALMAAAAYMAYRWLVQNGHIPDYLGIGGGAPVGGQLPAGQQSTGQTQQGQSTGQTTNGQQTTGNGQQSSSSGSGSNTAAGGSTSTGNLKDQVWNSAKNEATPNAGLLHFWKWNYYLPSNVAQPDPFGLSWASIGEQQPADADQVIQTPLTLDQWWTLVQPVLAPGGVSGISALRGVNHWSQQSSRWYGGGNALG